MQILIQSKKENLEKQFLILEQEKNQNQKTKEKIIYDNYINYLKRINSENKSSSKNFFIIIHQKGEFTKNIPNYNLEKIVIDKLNEKYFKIKETLSRCGNLIFEINKKETIDILYSFFNYRKNSMK
jgi:hypothetical protein